MEGGAVASMGGLLKRICSHDEVPAVAGIRSGSWRQSERTCWSVQLVHSTADKIGLLMAGKQWLDVACQDAAEGGCVDAVELLLELGANINARCRVRLTTTSDGATPAGAFHACVVMHV
jgi:hypothetical protein